MGCILFEQAMISVNSNYFAHLPFLFFIQLSQEEALQFFSAFAVLRIFLSSDTLFFISFDGSAYVRHKVGNFLSSSISLFFLKLLFAEARLMSASKDKNGL